MASRRTSGVLTAAVLGSALLLGAWLVAPGFVSQPQSRLAVATAAGVAAPAVLGVMPALAGEPPSVGEHWYWDIGFGTLHGETASIIFLVFFLLVLLSLLGLGGSSRRAA
eukprot:CAMPEP_0170597102 /NCGR_PEP_ID=MMETSP0224-20130122/15521_1 /TAXON_ID=285029 /ORGANISM="Togula jolla, Strain CCCM 725" /LENGTH=109 /DNA_ID=CAMNT_0010921537 /DNA_START=60 /DNA_END=389 /DNA_ORIENTATION=-